MSKILKNILVTSFSKGGKTHFVNKLLEHPMANYQLCNFVDMPAIVEVKYDEVLPLCNQYGSSVYPVVLMPNVQTRLNWLIKEGIEECERYQIVGRSEAEERKILDRHDKLYKQIVKGYGESVDLDNLIEKIHQEICSS